MRLALRQAAPAAHITPLARPAQHACPLPPPPPIQYQNLIGPHHGWQAVGDGNHRSPLRQHFQRRAEQRFLLGIQVRGRLIQQQQRSIFQIGPRQRQPLRLPAAQPRALFANLCFIAPRQGRDHIIQVRDPGRFPQLIQAGILFSYAQIRGNAVMEQERRLRHPGDPCPPVL